MHCLLAWTILVSGAQVLMREDYLPAKYVAEVHDLAVNKLL